MSKMKKTPTFKAQATLHIDEEALQIARATQSPAQTKEQTKLIAKGIAKGIAQYKQQEKLKQRTRNKLQKKPKDNASTLRTNNGISSNQALTLRTKASTIRWALRISTSVFFLVGILHLVRYAFATPLLIGTFTVPVFWSLPAAVVALLLAAGYLRVHPASLDSTVYLDS